MEWNKDACSLRWYASSTSHKWYSMTSMIWTWACTSATISMGHYLTWGVCSKDQNYGEITTRSAHCRWLCSYGPQCTASTGNCWRILWSCKRGINDQSQQDRGPSPACTSDPSSRALYHHRWHSAKECRVVQSQISSTTSNNRTLHREITARIQKAIQASSKLRIKVVQHNEPRSSREGQYY